MTGRPGVFTTLPVVIVLALIACAPATQTQPVDPVKAQITVLQKQLLELQNLQNENRRKVEEQATIAEALAPASSSSPHQITSIPSSAQTVALEKIRKRP